MDKLLLKKMGKQILLAMLILSLAVPPVFGLEGTSAQNAAGQAETAGQQKTVQDEPQTEQPTEMTVKTQTEQSAERKVVQDADSQEAALGPMVDATAIDMNDPENNKYYGYDENGILRKKITSGNELSAVAASGNYVHPERYAGCTIYDCIDVSAHQSDINWEKVKKDGITHAIIRVAYQGQSDGGLYKDSRYIENIQEAYDAGIQVGVYIYSQAITEKEAVAGADYIMSCIEPYKSMITMPVVFDYEFGIPKSQGGRFYAGRLSNAKMTAICQAFCEQVKASGYEPMVYANANMLTSYLDRDVLSSQYKIWLAHYTTNTGYTGEFYMWQYTSSGSVNGISGRVDMNFIYETGGWILDEATGKYRYLKGDGVTYAKSEWITLGGKKYYVASDGFRVTGYKKIGDYYYGFNDNGVMLTGSKKIDGKQYKFMKDGRAYRYSAQFKKTAKYRTGPSKKYKKKGTYKKWKVVYIIREKNGWGMMSNGYWVKLTNVKKVTKYPYKVDASSYKVQLKTSLNYRTGPGTKYKKKGTYKKWKVVTIKAKKNGWGKMKNGYWIKLSYTKRV